jgi:hypothetical protein
MRFLLGLFLALVVAFAVPDTAVCQTNSTDDTTNILIENDVEIVNYALLAEVENVQLNVEPQKECISVCCCRNIANTNVKNHIYENLFILTANSAINEKGWYSLGPIHQWIKNRFNCMDENNLSNPNTPANAPMILTSNIGPIHQWIKS